MLDVQRLRVVRVGRTEHALDDVAQFRDVARPRQRAEERERGRRERARRGAAFRARVLEQPHRHRRHIVGAIAQRRQIDARRRETAVQIRAEALILDVGVDAGGRARHEADRRGGRLAVDAHFAVARDPREAGLHGGGQLAGVAEKERAAAGARDQAAGGCRLEVGRGKRALAEERGVESVSAAIDR